MELTGTSDNRIIFDGNTATGEDSANLIYGGMVQFLNVHKVLTGTYITCKQNTGGIYGSCFRLNYSTITNRPTLSNLLCKNNSSANLNSSRGLGIYVSAEGDSHMELSVTDSTFEGNTAS